MKRILTFTPLRWEIFPYPRSLSGLFSLPNWCKKFESSPIYFSVFQSILTQINRLFGLGSCCCSGFCIGWWTLFDSVCAIFSFCGSEDFSALINFNCLILDFLGFFENVDMHEKELWRAAENAMEILFIEFLTVHSFLDKGLLCWILNDRLPRVCLKHLIEFIYYYYFSFLSKLEIYNFYN